jgi:outer membrane protein assembly factor BamB/actin-like ATPase involved in cell morphogenesis
MGTLTAVDPLEVDGNRWMPSMVLYDPDGNILVGVAADNQAGIYPDRVERTPKRHLGTGAPLVLGGHPVEVPRVVAELLKVFIAEGRLRHGGEPPAHTVLTHPVRWGDERKDALLAAAELAGLPSPQLVEEPVAAAVHYVSKQVEVSEYLGVYDLGGGTFDTAILVRTDHGFETVGAPGGDEQIGGEHFDHKLFQYFGQCLAEDAPEIWDLLMNSDERKWKRAALDLLVEARRAKEALSSYTSAKVFVSSADRDIVITRGQFDDMIREEVESTVAEMDDTIASAGLTSADLKAIFLVGGSSRIPLVVQMMTERFADKIDTRDEPKSVVALGAAAIVRELLTNGKKVGADGIREAEPLVVVDPVQFQTPPWTPPQPQPQQPQLEGAFQLRVRAEEAGNWARGGPSVGSTVPPLGPDTSATTTAEPVWQQQLTRLAGQIATDGTVVFFGTDASQLHAVDASSGTNRWVAATSASVSAPPAVGWGRVFVACANGVVAAHDIGSGAPLWHVPSGAAIQAWPVAAYDLVVVGNESGFLAALDSSTGVVRWQVPLGRPVRTVAAGGPFVLAGAADGRVYAVDIGTGGVRWAYPTRGIVQAQPAVGDGIAYVGSSDGIVYALDVLSGQPKWAYRTGGPIASPPVLDEGYLYVGSGDGSLYALDRGTGMAAWAHHVGGANLAGPVVADGVLYLDGGGGNLEAIDLVARTVRWRTPTGALNRCRAVVAGGKVVFGTSFARICAVDI